MSVFTNRASRSKEEAGAYTAAVLGLVEGRQPREVLGATEAALRAALAGTPRAALRTPEAPDKWSVCQVLCHLADSELVWGWRLRLVLAQERPPMTGYDQDAWAERLGYNDSDADLEMETFATLRRRNLRLLDGAAPADLKRVGVHSERGEESVEHMIKLYAGHDLLHLRQIERIRKAVTS